MKKIIKTIKDSFIVLYLSLDFGMIKFTFLPIYKSAKENGLLDFVEKKARELAENEGIKIYLVPFDEMNKNETVESNKAVGVFRYVNGKYKAKYQKIISDYIKDKGVFDLPQDYVFPRIEISEKGDVFTILHELGHYFIYKRGEEQTEKGAEAFIEEFFETHLPPFFKWIFQIEIAIRKENKERNFSLLECYNYLKEYKKFIKNK